MQRAGVARIGAKPQFSVKYWTADAEGSSLIKAWLEEETDRPLAFYGSFVNWCSQQVDRIKNPSTKYRDEVDRERAHLVREVLREDPLDPRRFVGIMESYQGDGWEAGLKSGTITHPDGEDTYALKLGQDQLRRVVWTKAEREAMMVAAGRESELPRKAKKKLERARQAAEKEKEKQSALGEWKETEEAIGEAEDEIEVEESTTALGRVEISERQPWEGDLTDRTK